MLNLRFIAALLLVASSLAVCVCGNLLTKNIEKELLVTVSKIDPVSNSGDTESTVRALSEKWSEKEKILTLFIDHVHCDRIGSFITQIEYYSKNSDKDSLSQSCYQLSKLLEEMIEQEKISIYNLL